MQSKIQNSEVSITEFGRNIKKFTKDTTKELALTSNGDIVGFYIGVDSWRAIQEMIRLLNNPQALVNSLELHRVFHETGKPTGITLEEFESKLQQLPKNTSP